MTARHLAWGIEKEIPINILSVQHQDAPDVEGPGMLAALGNRGSDAGDPNRSVKRKEREVRYEVCANCSIDGRNHGPRESR